MYTSSQIPRKPEELRKMPRYYLENLVKEGLLFDYIYQITDQGDLIESYENWDRKSFMKALKDQHNSTVSKAAEFLQRNNVIKASLTIGVDVAKILKEYLKIKLDTVYVIKRGDEYLSVYSPDWDDLIHAKLFSSKEDATWSVNQYHLTDVTVIPFTFKEKLC